ncbi:Calcium-transporting ATPase 2 [Hypsizygus marmoreus]|uniref:Calcium-transporting ATPase n=1 Tax=Hypsizygus marmoreus TaxID=39966 RepID=A0A369JXA0_HYPMA|nr:Calcium-transporting ATPase 2 [Hypsizygus marmoreus]
MPRDDIPSIAIIEDSTSNVVDNNQTDAGLLSPNAPRSPAATDTGDDSSSLNVPPPSPTLSTRSSGSVHFNTSTALRDNNPEEPSSHLRKASNATFNSVSTIPDSSNAAELAERRTMDSGITAVPSEGHAQDEKKKGKKKKGKKGGEEDDEPKLTTHQFELEQDRNTDPAPFAFRPYELAHMLDPKNMDALTQYGGTEGLLRGLGTNAETGLSKDALAVNSGAVAHHALFVAREKEKAKAEKKAKGWKGAGHGASHRHKTEKGKQSTESAESEKEVPESTPPSPTDESIYDVSVDERRRVYGPNILPTRPSKSLLQLMWMALKDKVLVLLSIAAVVSLALGLFQDFGTPRPEGEAPVDWVEGVAIMVAVAIVVIVGSVNDWQKERQFKTLNDKKEERGVKVIRDGDERVIDIKEVVVGDIALLEPGEIIPCDGVFLSGHNVKCDESGATGESDAIKKLSYEDCIEHTKQGGKQAAHTDCFVVSGSKVLEGVGRYVVVAVGTKSFNGRIMMALRGDTENTPLQLKLNALAELIAKIGSVAGLILFSALMIRFFVQLGTGTPTRTPNQKGIAFVNILIISVTLIVVAVPEGLPLAVTLALAFATKRMTYEKLLVRVLGSCETMANASVVCTDKTGTLTQNVMTVVAGSVGIHAKFVRQLEENAERTNADGKDDEDSDKRRAERDGQPRKHRDDFSIDQAQLNTVLPASLRVLFNEAIAINSTAFEDVDTESGEVVFVGSKTETALLQFAKELGWGSFRETREKAEVVQMIPFSSERKAMGVVVKKKNGKGYRVYMKGASEILSRKCTRHVVVNQPGQADAEKEKGEDEVIETKAIDELAKENISRTIIFYANQTLRTIALCYRDFESWPPAGMAQDENEEVPFEDLAKDLVLIGITGIEDPLRDGVRDAVAKCHRAGVTVKMCTGDNVLTARSIATQCGIFTPGGIIMEGPVFRKLNQAEMVEIVPRLQVLARSSPEDKKVLVETLKSIGEIVGVTGDGTNDGPALKTAHVGFSMGIAGTEVAKEASDIILMDDNFASIVKAIMWGRCVNDAVRKFLQFQISTNVTAVIITFVSAVASAEEESVLSAVQLLWINIIMDTFAALALATDPATESLLDRMPDKQTAPLFSVNMYKQIMWQSIYQITVILIFHFLGFTILGLSNTGDVKADKHSHLVVKTLVFNAFVFAQIFNSVNCRRLDRKLNIFEGIFRNRYFLIITFIEIAVQILIVFVGGDAFQVTRIAGREWGISLALGVVAIPLGALIRLMPNGPFEKLFKKLGLLGRRRALPTISPEAEEAWSGAVALVRGDLGTFAKLRGGRLRSSSYVIKSRLSRKSQEQQPPLRVSSLMTMVPTLIAGTIATGQKTKQSGSLSDPADSDPSKSSAALWEGRLQLHPDTPHDDPAYQRYGAGNQNMS